MYTDEEWVMIRDLMLMIQSAQYHSVEELIAGYLESSPGADRGMIDQSLSRLGRILVDNDFQGMASDPGMCVRDSEIA